MNGAIFGRVERLQAISGADRIQVATVLGTPCIVGMDVRVGDEGVLFPAGVCLSPKYLAHNNLYRDSSKNRDTTKVGYFEDLGRVRAQPFRGARSEGLFMPVGSLDCFFLLGTAVFVEGQEFDSLAGEKLCWKYRKQRSIPSRLCKAKKKAKRLGCPGFVEHQDTVQWRFYSGSVPSDALVTVSPKFHGTSARFGIHEVVRKLSLWEKVKKLFGFGPEEKVWKPILGTRRVAYLEERRDGVGWHGSTGFLYKWLDQLELFLERGMTVYGEIVGYANGKLIMPPHKTGALSTKAYERKYGPVVSYTYGCQEGENDLWIYRITSVKDGKTVEWSPKEIQEWCDEYSFNSVYENAYTTTGRFFEKNRGDEDVLRLIGLNPEELYEDPLNPGCVAEGAVVRIDSKAGVRFLKAKTFPFKVMEGIAQEEEGDPEDESGLEVEATDNA